MTDQKRILLLPKKISNKEFIVDDKKETQVHRADLPKVQANYGILNFIKTELLLLIRHGEKWLWALNLIGMILLAVLPLAKAHFLVLPILWFLQVGRLSELNTKEVAYGVHYFAFASYKPMTRLLFSQLVSGIALLLFLVLPLLVRYAVIGNFSALLPIVFGGIFVVLLASSLGILTKGKKLFEVLFFMITYANINNIAFLDYFGGMTHDSWYLLKLTLCCIFLGVISTTMRISQLRT